MRSAVKTRLSLAQRQPANADLNLAADDRSTERSNHACVIVLNIENMKRLFFVFWKLHSKSTWLKNSEGARAPHFEWAWRLWGQKYRIVLLPIV